MKFRFLSLLTGAAVASIGLSACDSTTTTNINANLRNSNTAVVVNATPVSNTNRWSNSNVNRADYDKNRAEYEKDKDKSTIGSGVNDSWLWFKTRSALLTTSDLRESTINVDVVNDVITLKGTVATEAQKKKAFDVASAIEGKKSVKNELKVAPADSMTNTSGNTNKR